MMGDVMMKKNSLSIHPSELLSGSSVRLVLLFSLAISLLSCGSQRAIKTSSNKLPAKQNKSVLVSKAKEFIGTPYVWGGSSKQGMDCSGLIYQSFKAIHLEVPRTTEGLMQKGRKISRSKLKTGDLVFFKTLKSKAKATHVGMITQNKKNETLFIHAGTSTGVTISKLQDGYWKKHFVFARRLL
jgi:cell wall-associated NlpC family hydrolase